MQLGYMKAYLLAFALAAGSTALLVPLVRWVALRVGAVSRPGGRNVNARTVPRLGGVAIAIGLMVPLVTILPAQSFVASTLRIEWHKVVGVFAGALILTTIGVLDDTRRVRARYKLLAQVVAATIAYTAGIRIDAVELPVFGILQMGVFALPVTVAWIVGIVNAVNLIDGLDGLAAGIVFFAGLTNFIVAYVSGEVMVGAFMATMLGAVLGFLVFNFNPARIFMGDSGSYLLGFILGTMSLLGAAQKASTAVSLVVPILALGVPLFDTLFTMARRFLERRPLFSPDRGHVHHRLLDMGLTHRRAVFILYGISLAFACMAIGVSLGRSWQVGVALIAACTVIVGLVRFLGYFEYILLVRRQRARVRGRDTERLRCLLPELIGAVASAESEEIVFGLLEDLVKGAELGAVELVPADGDACIQRWSRELVADPSEIVSARYPLGEDGRARTHLRVRWWSSDGEVGPQTEVLLQVVADVVALAFSRTGSAYAPTAAAVQASSEPVRIAPTLAEPTRT